MTNRFQELRDKEVIHVCEGTRLGYVNDLVIDICCGRVTALIVPGPCRSTGRLPSGARRGRSGGCSEGEKSAEHAGETAKKCLHSGRFSAIMSRRCAKTATLRTHTQGDGVFRCSAARSEGG